MLNKHCRQIAKALCTKSVLLFMPCLIAGQLSLSFPFFTSYVYAENVETESETEQPDERAIWYNEHLPAFHQEDDTDYLIEDLSAQSKAPERLLKLAFTDEEVHAASKKDVRRKVKRYLKKEKAYLLQDADTLHYIYTDEVDYVVCALKEQTYLFLVTYKKNGKSIVAEADVDADTRKELLSIASHNSQVDEHYWNGILTDDTDGAYLKELPHSPDHVMAIPYFNQGLGFWSGRKWQCRDWPDYTFDLNGHTMHEAACGFFASAMAISYLKQEIVSPIEFKENGQYIGDGAAMTVALESAGQYGIRAVLTGSWEEAYEALKAGHPVMENVGPSVFTNSGHYVLMIGILPDGTIAVNDPGNEYNTYWYSFASFDTDTMAMAQKGQYTTYTILG